MDATFVDEFTALFENAVDLRMLADVPVGILLSGGLESPALSPRPRAATVPRSRASRLLSRAPAEIDERDYARMVASTSQNRSS